MPYLIQYRTCSVLTIRFPSASFSVFCCLVFVYRIFCSVGFSTPFHLFMTSGNSGAIRTIKMKYLQLKIYTFFVANMFTLSLIEFLPFSFYLPIHSFIWMQRNGRTKENGNAHLNLLRNCSVNDVIYIQAIHFHRFWNEWFFPIRMYSAA